MKNVLKYLAVFAKEAPPRNKRKIVTSVAVLEQKICMLNSS
jgi:hypothetical protein